MDFSLSAADAELIQTFRAYLDTFDPAELAGASSFDILDMKDRGYDFRRRLGEDGWLALSWPTEYGGRGLTAIQEWLVTEELAARRLPLPGLSLTSIGPTLIRVGTHEQKSELLPGLRDGSKLFCLGYTEPEAGSDLASLRTTARREGDEFVIDGQKIFTSGAHHATHIWVAARTDPTVPKHQGISVLIVPTGTEGVTITPLITQAGGRSNQVFFDDVRVPVANLAGAENQGWDIIKMALDFERTALIPSALPMRDLWDLARANPELGALGDPEDTPRALATTSAREEWAELVVDAELARVLFLRAAWMVDSGMVPKAEASMAKVWSSETRQRLASKALDILGPAGQFLATAERRSDEGDLTWVYLFSPVKVFGGGTNDVQRQIIARERLKGA